MALKKDKPADSPARKTASLRPAAAAPPTVAAPAPNNSQRLLREAAWSRMFGRTESKNPFARSR